MAINWQQLVNLKSQISSTASKKRMASNLSKLLQSVEMSKDKESLVKKLDTLIGKTVGSVDKVSDIAGNIKQVARFLPGGWGTAISGITSGFQADKTKKEYGELVRAIESIMPERSFLTQIARSGLEEAKGLYRDAPGVLRSMTEDVLKNVIMSKTLGKAGEETIETSVPSYDEIAPQATKDISGEAIAPKMSTSITKTTAPVKKTLSEMGFGEKFKFGTDFKSLFQKGFSSPEARKKLMEIAYMWEPTLSKSKSSYQSSLLDYLKY